MPNKESSDSLNRDELSATGIEFHSPALVAAQNPITDQSRINSGSTLQDDLRQALLDIGRNEKELGVKALVKYRALLDSPEIRQRAKAGANDIELAECAARTILDFIDNHIAESRDKLVMQAALAATKEFEGQLVSERMRALPISEADFKRRRRKQFAELIRYLLRYAPPATLRPARDTSLSHEDEAHIRYTFYKLSRKSLRLFFACIGGLWEHDISPGSFSGARGTAELYPEYVFDCFREFQIMGNHWCAGIPPADRLAVPEWTQELDSMLVDHIQKVNDFWPLTKHVDQRGFFVPELEKIISRGGVLDREDQYYEVWLPWYSKNPALVERLCVDSGAIADLLSYVNHATIKDARNDALHRLKLCYEERWDEANNGQTLHDYASQYFREKASHLLKSRYFGIIDKIDGV